ncbi:MAG TPA: FAD-linked oxidase C-terminal domain-containing protein, partial [Candidatus Polarisedimenticolia bacterium]|nr:FAD-linked oxidase C-terminal domain-containing protein [Candidatus Polarisedimenticolia bacterium]
MNDLTHLEPRDVATDLQARVEGEVLCDEVSRTLYSTAACIYQVRPLGAVAPRHEADVLAVLDHARRHAIPVTARGGGSGLAGQTLGRGLILDLSRHFGVIGAVDPEVRTVRAGPGVIAARLNHALEPQGLLFAPDPSSSAWCTLGGMIANNAGGSHTIQHGATRENIVSLRVALASGQVIETAPGAPDPTGARARLTAGLGGILRSHRAIIEARQPATKRNSSGYALRELLAAAHTADDRPMDLAPLFAGSEGTLGIVLDATLRLQPIAKTKATALVLFDDLEKSGAGVVEVLRARPAAVELLDRTFVEVIREADPERSAGLPSDTEAILIVELQGDDPAEVQARMETLREDLVGRRRLATEVRTTTRPDEMARIWAIRKAASPILSRREGRLRNTRFIEDAAVHPERMADFVRALRALLGQHGLKAAIFGHAGDCNLHCNPLMNPKDPRDLAKMEAIAAEFTDLVVGLGGSLSGEHGDGRLRTPYLERAYGPLADVFREVKELFDPEGLLNPGIIVHDGRTRLTDDLRYGATYRRVATTTPVDDPGWQREIEKCHGCGACRDYCPVAADS